MKTKHNELVLLEAVKMGLLEIDDKGRIWKVAERRIGRWGTTRATKRPCPRKRAEHDNGSYLQVRWMVNGERTMALAHRLVWVHFNGPIQGALVVNHRNGKKKDNRPENLEIVTHKKNAQHAVRTLGVGTTLNQRGEKNPSAKLTATEVVQIRQRRADGEQLKSLAKAFGVSFQAISKIARFDRW
jgi:hypothetical protein